VRSDGGVPSRASTATSHTFWFQSVTASAEAESAKASVAAASAARASGPRRAIS
jgi:hypothetical protein